MADNGPVQDVTTAPENRAQLVAPIAPVNSVRELSKEIMGLDRDILQLELRRLEKKNQILELNEEIFKLQEKKAHDEAAATKLENEIGSLRKSKGNKLRLMEHLKRQRIENYQQLQLSRLIRNIAKTARQTEETIRVENHENQGQTQSSGNQQNQSGAGSENERQNERSASPTSSTSTCTPSSTSSSASTGSFSQTLTTPNSSVHITVKVSADPTTPQSANKLSRKRRISYTEAETQCDSPTKTGKSASTESRSRRDSDATNVSSSQEGISVKKELNTYACKYKYCKRKYTRFGVLVNHIKTKHGDRKISPDAAPCTECNEWFDNKRLMQKHHHEEHSSDDDEDQE